MASVKTAAKGRNYLSLVFCGLYTGGLEVVAYDKVPNKSAITFTICDFLERAARVVRGGAIERVRLSGH